MKSLFGRTGPGRFIWELLSSFTRGHPTLAVLFRTQRLTEPRKILVVDDDPVILKALTLKLDSEGYTVVKAVDGADALRVLQDEKPDLVLLDINYPPDVAHGGGVPWDGFLLMRWLRGIEKVGAVPIIFMTSSDSRGCRERALSCGAMGL